jgi:hypothetical protein
MPPLLTAAYEATYRFDQATGWPVALDVSVRYQTGPVYSKEYFFRLEQLPVL